MPFFYALHRCVFGINLSIFDELPKLILI
ncbi:hypothetical protein RTM1035_10520 [Roseovarius sp. TM1035]|nr:hypothetical protein RTM1035_10520 [Roseovarius sp. TM1035]